jgi:hypothetical protein
MPASAKANLPEICFLDCADTSEDLEVATWAAALAADCTVPVMLDSRGEYDLVLSVDNPELAGSDGGPFGTTLEALSQLLLGSTLWRILAGSLVIIAVDSLHPMSPKLARGGLSSKGTGTDAGWRARKPP